MNRDYYIHDQDGTPIPHDPDDDDFDSDLDTVDAPTTPHTDHDYGNPVGADPMSDDEAAFWHDANRIMTYGSITTI